MQTIVFYGATKYGRETLARWRYIGLCPSYFIDSDETKWNSFLDGVKIISPCCLKILPVPIILVTTEKRKDEIIESLVAGGFPSYNIYTPNDFWNWDFISGFYEIFFKAKHFTPPVVMNGEKRILFDVANGLVLGGVERWCINSGTILQKKGFNVSLLTNNFAPVELESNGLNIVKVPAKKDFSSLEWVVATMETIGMQLPLVVICNFATVPLFAACAIKHNLNDKIRIIAVVHNDEDIYFQYYGFLEKYLNCVLVISKKIQEKLASVGIPKAKMVKLSWNINFPVNLCRMYSKCGSPLRLGYAGRVVVLQKRMDILFSVALRLRELGIDFLLQIAGTGDYVNILQELIEKNCMQNYIQLLGCVENHLIADFWSKQDILISCSDYEGRSISKAEAMAQGCVPVVTDTSGAEDDIIDGENGFVVPVGDVDAMVEKLFFLYQNRSELSRMGHLAYDAIRENCSYQVVEAMWKKILGESFYDDTKEIV